jgi:hypothetical protein
MMDFASANTLENFCSGFNKRKRAEEFWGRFSDEKKK